MLSSLRIRHHEWCNFCPLPFGSATMSGVTFALCPEFLHPTPWSGPFVGQTLTRDRCAKYIASRADSHLRLARFHGSCLLCTCSRYSGGATALGWRKQQIPCLPSASFTLRLVATKNRIMKTGYLQMRTPTAWTTLTSSHRLEDTWRKCGAFAPTRLRVEAKFMASDLVDVARRFSSCSCSPPCSGRSPALLE